MKSPSATKRKKSKSKKKDILCINVRLRVPKDIGDDPLFTKKVILQLLIAYAEGKGKARWFQVDAIDWQRNDEKVQTNIHTLKTLKRFLAVIKSSADIRIGRVRNDTTQARHR